MQRVFYGTCIYLDECILFKGLRHPKTGELSLSLIPSFLSTLTLQCGAWLVLSDPAVAFPRPQRTSQNSRNRIGAGAGGAVVARWPRNTCEVPPAPYACLQAHVMNAFLPKQCTESVLANVEILFKRVGENKLILKIIMRYRNLTQWDITQLHI